MLSGFTYGWTIALNQSGVYQINYEDLHPMNSSQSLNFKHFALFRLGKRCGIHINSSDTLWNAGDSIVFFAQAPDGTLDAALYGDSACVAQPQLNLFTDTATYFLCYYPNRTFDDLISPKSYSGVETPTTTAWQRQEQVFRQYYFTGLTAKGTYENEQLFESAYTTGEGWMSTPIKGKNTFVQTYSLLQKSGDSVEVQLRLIGQTTQNQKVLLSFGKKTPTDTLILQESTPFVIKKWLVTTDKSFSISLQGYDEKSLFSVAEISYNFQRPFDAQLGWWYWPNRQTKKLQGQGTQAKNRNYWDISNPLQPLHLTVTQTGSTFELVHQASTLFAFDIPLKPQKIAAYDTTSFDTQANFYIITHPNFLANDTLRSIQQYTQYRSSDTGRKFRCHVVSTTQLYQNFTYGDKSPLAIKRFVEKMTKNNSTKKYFLILGKGLAPTLTRFNPSLYAEDYVPAWGLPCSDTPYTLDTAGHAMAAIGRIASNNPQEILHYLEKVKAYEASLTLGLWKKRILHLAGGRYPNEQQTFKTHIDSLANVCRKYNTGWQIHTLSKTSDAPVEQQNTTQFINEGINLITSFGHSAIGQLDLDIGWASNPALGYHNSPKYPFIMVNGCDAGDSFSTTPALGTDWILAQNKGAIGFLAHTHLAYPPYLLGFSSAFYTRLFSDSLGITVGEILQQTIQSLQANYVNPYWRTTIEQFTLQGDPTIILLQSISKPDLSIKKLLVNTDEKDSLRLSFQITNTGKRLASNCTLRIIHEHEGRVLFSQDRPYTSPVNFADTLSLAIPYLFRPMGHHKLSVQIDARQQHQEWNENNNEQSYSWILQDSSIIVLAPTLYSIINTPDCIFSGIIPKATTTPQLQIQGFQKEQLRFEKTYLLPKQGFFSIPLDLLTQDSTTYFWTIKSDSFLLKQGSFTYLSQVQSGWAQLNSLEWTSLQTDSLYHISPNGWFRKPRHSAINALIAGADVSKGNYLTELRINQQPYLNNGLCYPWNSLNALSFDQNLQPYRLIPSLACGCSPYYLNNLEESLLPNQNALESYLSQVPTDDYVLLMSHGRVNAGNWSMEVQQSLQQMGINPSRIQSLKSGTPFFIFAQKGHKVLYEQYGKTAKDTLLIHFSHEALPNYSSLQTPWIGPARTWQKLLSNLSKGNHYVQIFGKNAQGDSVLLLEKAWENDVDLQTIQASTYPFISVRWLVSHRDTATTQVSGWGLLGEPFSQGFLRLQAPIQERFQEAEPLQWRAVYFPTKNSWHLDYLVYTQRIFDESGKIIQSQTTPLLSTQADSVAFSIQLPALASGKYWLQVAVHSANTIVSLQPQHQSLVSFQILADQQAPVLAIYWHNQLLKPWQSIQANDSLRLELSDNNPYKQPLRIELSAQACKNCPSEKQKVSFLHHYSSLQQQTLNWQYFPSFTNSDTLWLRVQGFDASNNPASLQPYEIALTRSTEAQHSWVMVHPNPFSEYVHFVVNNVFFSTPIAYIQIFDSFGSLQAEWKETLKFGENDLVWDTRKKNGLILPNGTYFYKIFLLNESLVRDIHTGKISIYH